MIRFRSTLKGNIPEGLKAFEKKVAESVIFTGVAAGARVLYEEVKRNASPPRMGEKTGKLQNSIYRVYSPERSPDGVKTYRVSWNKSKAPHGHLLEFGTSRMPAKPFVRPAFDRMGEAIAAGKKAMERRLDRGVV